MRMDVLNMNVHYACLAVLCLIQSYSNVPEMCKEMFMRMSKLKFHSKCRMRFKITSCVAANKMY